MTMSRLIKKYKIENFIKIVKRDLSKYKGKLILKKPDLNNNRFDGEFSESEMTIQCFVDPSSSYWIGVLAHEYAHFLQCINGNKLWENFQNEAFDNINDLQSAFHNKKKKIRKNLRRKIVKHIVRMELDCDKKAINIINKYKLPVDKNEYRSKANIVLYKYLFWEEYGIWPSLNNPKTSRVHNLRELKVSKLLDEEKYKSANDIPRKIFYIFKENIR